MYSHLVDDNSEHTKAKSVNNNVVARISHNEYKDVLLNKKCLRYSMNRIPSEDHRIGTYKRFIFLALMIKYTLKTMDLMK